MNAPPDCSGYSLIRRLGGGSFCDAWLAARPGQSPVVVKRALDATGERMLAGEAAAAVQLRGLPGVALVSALVREPVPHVVMPYLGDHTFRHTLTAVASADDRARATSVFLTLVDVVSAVHRRGIVHGDLKPENVIVDRELGPQVIDFGLSRALQAHRLQQSLVHSLGSHALTGGTLDYMPPEAVKGAEPSFAGDVFALGTMLHEVLLGQRPSRGASAAELERRLPAELVEILTRALAYDPRTRYADAHKLRLALREHAAAMTALGIDRRRRAVGRAVLRALAAFFVALRYASVLALLATYAAIAAAFVLGPFTSTGIASVPMLVLLVVPILMLHCVVRWEGPESAAEASHREGKLTHRGPPIKRRRIPRR